MATSLLPAIYPMLKSGFDLSFAQIGVLTLVYQGIASMLQPVIGLYTDHRPQPYFLPFGMTCTLLGLATLAFAPSYLVLLAGGGLLGIGSAIFHPELSRLARLASGGAHGFAQSLFQVGGNAGNSLAPLLAAFFILPRGQSSIAWFALVALAGIIVLSVVGRWYKNSGHTVRKSARSAAARLALPAAQVRRAIAVLVALIFSKFFYLSSITSYYIFYLMHRFDMSTQSAQLCLFVFLVSAAVGTFVGGPIGDRIGRKRVIWASILGVLPFTLALPYVGLPATIVLSVLIGLDIVIRVLGDRGLCPGTDAGARRHGVGTFLRPRLWHGRHRRRGFGGAGRLDQHSIRLSGLLVSAADRPFDRVPARRQA